MTEKPKQDPMVEQTASELSLLPHQESYAAMFKKVSRLTEDDLIVRSNCRFCTHPIRAQAEDRFERSNRTSFLVVEKLFRDYEKANPDATVMSYQSIRNHLQKHYLQQEKQIYLREYGERLTDWVNQRVDQDRQFEALLKSAELKFHEIASDPNLCPLKQADAMTKLTKSILEITQLQAQLRGDLNTGDIIQEKVMNIWLHAIETQTDPQLQLKLREMLDMFEQNSQNVEIQQ